MSDVYATEPATSGRVIFETSHGPLDIQLWCRECPETTRFFLQLCMDGFYDHMVFHRIIPSFLIQTGALRQPSVQVKHDELEQYRTAVHATRALERRKYEVHSRLHFNHRGQLAMALGVDDDDDEEIHPQFFVTLDETSHLDGKQVIFGTVVGPTLFNAIRIGQCDVDEATNLPAGELTYAPRVISVKIVENPFHTSLAPQAVVPWHAKVQTDPAKRKRKRKGKKDMNVLSFGDEMEEETEISTGGGGMKSSHDVLESKTLSKNVDATVKETMAKATIDRDATEKKEQQQERNVPKSLSNDLVSKLSDVTTVFETKEGGPTLEKRQIQRDSSENRRLSTFDSHAMKSDRHGLHEGASREQENLLESRREKYAKGRKSKKERENETIEKLLAFRSKVQTNKKTEQSFESGTTDSSLASRMAQRVQQSSQALPDDAAPSYHGQILDSDDDKSGSDWLQTKFKCRRHMDLTLGEEEEAHIGGDGRRMDEYEVLDEKNRSRHDPSKHDKANKRDKDRGRTSRR